MAADQSRFEKAALAMRWLPDSMWQRLVRRPYRGRTHIVLAVADHFEPSICPAAPERYASPIEQEARLESWCRRYPESVERWRDADGQPFRHTYFFPAEQYDKGLVSALARHCREGWGEVEIHLHHGTEKPDTSERTRLTLQQFRDALVKHGCLSRWNGTGEARYAFVHGNWALANSAGGANCGVDDEMQILADTGCYADFTLPSAPNRAQVAKINCLYECSGRLEEAVPHRHGKDLRVGRTPGRFPLIIQGPLQLAFDRSRLGRPRIENGELSGRRLPTLERFALWRRAAIRVHGRPDWLFVKLHCHGMDPRDETAMIGAAHRVFLQSLTEWSAATKNPIYFATAREMVNMLLAACDGRTGSPSAYRDYRLKLGS